MKRTRSVAEVVRVLRAGGTAVIPTDTAYALAADVTNRAAVAAAKRIKGRAANKPIAAIASTTSQVRKFFRFPKSAAPFVRAFWPGPLTLVLRPKRAVASSGLSRTGIGVRVPRNATARRIAQKLGRPITATSANRSGGRTPYTVAAVTRAFYRNAPDLLLDAGNLPIRPVSTVVRFHRSRIVVLRPGAIPEHQLYDLRRKP